VPHYSLIDAPLILGTHSIFPALDGVFLFNSTSSFVIGLPPLADMTSQAMAVGAVAGAIATATLARSSSGVFHVADDDTSSSSTKTNGSPTKTNGSHSYQRDKLAKSI
jgi:hypothetical protein